MKISILMTFQSSKIIMEKGDLIKNETISLIQNLFWQLSKLWYWKILWVQITDVNSKEKCKVFLSTQMVALMLWMAC